MCSIPYTSFELSKSLSLKHPILTYYPQIDPSQGGSAWFSSRHDPEGASGTVLRILYVIPLLLFPLSPPFLPTLTPNHPQYPSFSSPSPSSKGIRAGAHSDYGTLTLLFRLPHQAGLEILAPPSASNPNESWVPVPVQPPGTETDPFPPILVNIADLLSYWTGGLLKSTVHRVVFPPARSENGTEGHGEETGTNGSDNRADGGDNCTYGNENGHHIGPRGNGSITGTAPRGEDRYSIAFFLHPNRDTPLVPIPSPLIESRETSAVTGNTNGKVMTAHEHLMSRLAATYKWGKEDVEARKVLDGEV
jgi:hypothetical protein